MNIGTKRWIKGALAAFIGGFAGMLESGLGIFVLAPEKFAINHDLWKTLLTILVLGIIAGVKVMVAYLKQSPLPSDDDTTTPPLPPPPVNVGGARQEQKSETQSTQGASPVMKRSLTLGLVTILLASTIACSTAWVTTLDSILAAAAPALVNILDIVAVANGQPLNAQLASQINSDAAQIKSLAGDFANASSAAAPTVCGQLTSAINTYSADQQKVLSLAHVVDQNTQIKVTLLSNLVVGTVAAITAVIPSCQNATQAKTFKTTPPLQLRTFVADYNSVLVAPTGNQAVDKRTKQLRLPQHSRLVHYLTFGFAH